MLSHSSYRKRQITHNAHLEVSAKGVEVLTGSQLILNILVVWVCAFDQ
jgi:hypothetical protein